MSVFHDSLRQVLEDVHVFLSHSLRKEILSPVNTTLKEKLLSRLHQLQNDYPELQMDFNEFEEMADKTCHSSVSSPLSYVDMNAVNTKNCVFFPNDKESYDPVNPKENFENQSLTESEDSEAKVICEVAANDLDSCEKSGYLDKRRESLKGWLSPFQRRWCAIKDGTLYYYERASDRKQKGNISLLGYEARLVADDKKHEHCFELVCPGKRTYQFCATSETELKQWTSAVERYTQSVSKSSEEIYEVVDECTSQWYVGLWDCTGASDELDFNRGDLIRVLEVSTPDWWVGECKGKVGFVPKKYLMEAYENY